MKLIRKNKKGFTLVELIVVIAILAILALILIPAISGYVAKAESRGLESSARALQSQAVIYLSEDPAATETSLKTKLEGNVDPKYTINVTSLDLEENKYSFTLSTDKLKVIVNENGVSEASKVTEKPSEEK